MKNLQSKVFSRIFLLLVLFIPWYALTLAEFRGKEHTLSNITDILMQKALCGGLICCFCLIIIMFFYGRIDRKTIWNKLYLSEILTILAICSYEYFLIYAFVVLRGTFFTVIISTVSFSDTLLGWIISLVVLSPFLYLLRRWL